MRSNKLLNAIVKTAALASVLLASSVSNAADVYVQTESYAKDLFNSEAVEIASDIPMWRFICDPAAATNPDCEDSASGSSQINVVAGDTLNIHVKNTLPIPVSLIIPGQTESTAGANMPTMDGNRVRSFTLEAAAAGTQTYTWAGIRPGTYLYQSGTYPSIQVPMGLFGALVVRDPVTTVACANLQPPAYDDADSCYDDEVVLLFSELDPVQNAAVELAGATVSSYPSTINYSPSFLLVNGELSADLTGIGDDTGATPEASAVLLRLLNAGSRSHTPAIVGLDMTLIAEDGNVYPGNPLIQAQALLPAGKTLDAIVGAPANNETFALYDRTPDFTNTDLPYGGLVANIVANAGTPPPVPGVMSVDDTYNVTEDTAYNASPGVLFNDDPALSAATVSIVASPANGALTCPSIPASGICPDGTFTYTPNQDFSGTDGFTYTADTGSGVISGASVILNVSFVNDAPVAAVDGPYINTIGTEIVVDAAHGVLGNDADVDGDILEAVLEGTAPPGLTFMADGSFTYTGGSAASFDYHADDGNGGLSNTVTVDLQYRAPSNITLNVQEPGGVAVQEYRWTVEEDTMWQPDPSVTPAPTDTLATNFHRSYMPVIAQGCVGATACSADETQTPFTEVALEPGKHYYVSVLPADAMDVDNTGYRVGHTVGGARIPPSASSVTVIVNKEPLPYAQISAFIFEDSGPTNGAVDGGEEGLGGFQLTLEDAGGRYGISAGAMSQDADGNPLTNSLDCFGGATPAPGVILSCPDTPENQAAGVVGEVLIKNLFPGKYGVIVTPPEEGGTAANKWIQTSTIEGTKVIDAWVKAGEPAYFSEFGPAGWHVFVGFVNPERAAANNPGGGNTVTGKVTNLHMARPPNQTLADSGSNAALAHTRAWVGLNSEAGIGTNIAAVQADADGNFQIDNVPDGEFQLVVWDSYLDQVIAYRAVSLPTGGALGNVPVFQWFARLENNVFLDENEDGIRQEKEEPIAEQAVNLRWRDGSVYQSFPTDLDGFVPFDQVFPFFHWLVAEVDYTRFKATGLTVTVDAGGEISGGPYPGVLNPQIQTEDCTDGTCVSRVETGQILTEGFQGFLGQTSVFDWGKKPYEPGENGGISGIVYSGVTRAESDPRLTAGEPWETGIPRVKLRLYREVATSTGGTGLVLVDETETDSWDDNLPTNCPGGHPNDPVDPITKCYDGLRNFNQARPAVFDGGYAFNDIPAGTYVVEVVPPVGWELLKEEDVNVGFGDGYASVFVTAPGGAVIPAVPDPAIVEAAMAEVGIAQPPCVGEIREVPQTLSLFPRANAEAPFRGSMRPLCDRKRVILSDQGQAAADFTLFTGAPVAGHFAGMILDDIAQEFNPLSIQFGEKWAPPFVPVSIRDYKGNEISRVYSDQWGRMNGLVPSTFTANMPSPSGFSPAMHMTCMNDPGPILVDGELMVDPQYNPAYSNFCYTFQYMPGTTTYLDTPVLPIASFASGYNPADCALDDGTPMIRQVDGSGTGPLVASGGTVTITSLGTTVSVPNPAYEGPGSLGLAGQKTIVRDFGFGAQGPVSSVTIDGTPLTITSWDADTINATLPGGVSTGQLVVTRDNGNSTEHAVTVTVSNETPTTVSAGGSIQAAIDAASPGDLILVGPGVYNESVIMWKPVRLQGAGAGSTFINAIKAPTESLATWRQKMDDLFNAGDVDSLPNQPDGAAGFDSSEGAGVTVLGLDIQNGQNAFKHYGQGPRPPARIDGFSITGGDVGGGIMVNGWAHNLEIANNHVFGNSGSYHGGIRIGQPFLEAELPNNGGPFGLNEDINIHHNSITQNGGMGGAGGGLSITTGTDNYSVSNNYVCGNFTIGDGGGIGHLGLSDGGTIANNRIVLNQSFNQGVSVSGGGVFISGEPQAGALTQGSGDVTLDANFIQGNQAGAGHGGGIRTQFINGLDINNPNVNDWNTVTMTNNMVVNNVAGHSGAGIALQDTLRSMIVNNTIAHNDSTATVGALVSTNTSVPQPAGLSSMPHSALLEASIPNNRSEYRGFSNPIQLVNNILWQNRAFHYDATVGVAELQPVLAQSTVGECPATTAYLDIGVLGGAHALSPTFSVLSSTEGTIYHPGTHPTNTTDDPGFLDTYCNGGRVMATAPGSMLALPALDEGGNAWIDVRYGPLDVRGDYHINDATSSARGNGTDVDAPDHDFDNEARPQTTAATSLVDRGADEVEDGVVWVPGAAPGTVAYSPGAFGSVLTTDPPATLTITATVSGTDVTFDNPATTGPVAPFAITADTCSNSTVSDGGSCTFDVTYAPTTEGADSGSFTVASTSNGVASVATVNLSGNGVASVITFDPGLFGEVPVSTTETLTIAATVLGTPVTFSGAAITGDDFAIVDQACSTATCSVEVSYSPTAAGESEGSLTISSNGTGNPHTVLLSGTGVPQATVAFSAGDFGDVPTNTTATLTIDALVSGTTVTFDNPAASGPGAPFAIDSETCSGSTVSDGATCSFTVNYTPTVGGIDNGSFTVSSNAAGSPQTVNLTGNGVPPGVVAFTSASSGTLSGGLLDLGNRGSNASSTLTLTVSVSPVTFDAVTVVNTSNPGRFDEAGGTCEDATIPVGGTCTVVIDFNGAGNGTRTATLTVLHDGIGSPSTLSLTGR